MTAIAAITTGKFTVIVADTMYSYESITRYGSKLIQGENLVYGGAGEIGPIWRAIKSDKTWLKIPDIDQAYMRTLSLHKNIISDKQLDAAIHGADACVEELMIASKDRILVVDNYGADLPAVPLDEGRAYVEVSGDGRSFILGYIEGFLAAMTPTDRRKLWRSYNSVQKLLVDAQTNCAKNVPSIGGRLDTIILK